MPLLVGLIAGLTLADASVVCLALPAILVELDATVEEAAAVIGVYTLVLAVTALLAERVRVALGTGRTGPAGAVVFGAASVWCGAADSVEVLLVARGVQAAGAALVLVAAFDRLGAGRRWTAAAVFGTAVGPALGGALTELLDWRAIFYAQAPVAFAGAFALARAGVVAQPNGERRGGARPDRPGSLERAPRAAVALALVSAALTAVLFLLVLLLVSGWSLSPLAAALTVSVLPVAALAASRIPGEPRTLAAAGSLLLAGGVLALAFLPEAAVGWTIVPQLLAGVGMGLALPALAGGLLVERVPRDAARLIALRHVGITVALLLLAPIVSNELDATVLRTQERGTALVLDAEIPPLEKVDLAGVLLRGLDPEDPRDALQRGFDAAARDIDADPALLGALRARADETLMRGVNEAFAPAFLIASGLALLAALLLLVRRRLLALAALAAAIPPLALAIARPALEPEPVVIADPCEERDLPDAGDLEGVLQQQALRALDRAACRFGSSREELVLAFGDPALRRDYIERYGADPGELDDLLRGALPLPLP